MPRRDPRLALIPQTVNEAVADRAIRHSLFLEGFKTRQVNDILALLDQDVVPDLLDQLDKRLNRIATRGFDSGPESTRRLRELASALDQFGTNTRKLLEKNLNPVLLELSADEAQFQAGVVNATAELEFLLPSADLLDKVVTDRPFDGRVLKDHYAKLEADQQFALARAVQLGLVQGESNEQIVRRVVGTRAAGFRDGVFFKTRHQVRAFVRTAVNHTATQAREAVYERNRELLAKNGVMWVSTLDDRTCPICGVLDGQTFKPGEGQRPPAHFQCRCTTTPVLAGEPAPERIQYEDWLRRQSPETQNRALGITRAQLFRNGNLQIRHFVSENGNVLTLAQIRALDADAFAKFTKRKGLPERSIGDNRFSIKKGRGALSAADVKVVEDAINEIPASVRNIVRFGDVYVDNALDTRGTGMSGGNWAGFAWNNGSQARVAWRGSNRQPRWPVAQVRKTARHEFGHHVDNHFRIRAPGGALTQRSGPLGLHNSFNEAFEKDWAKLDPLQKQKAAYYNSNEAERWAETFNLAFAPNSVEEQAFRTNVPEARKMFPNAVKELKRLLKQAEDFSIKQDAKKRADFLQGIIDPKDQTLIDSGLMKESQIG